MRESEIKNVLTVAEVAEILRVHSTTIYRLVKRGDLPGFKLGGNWRINRASLDLWLSAEHSQPQAARHETPQQQSSHQPASHHHNPRSH